MADKARMAVFHGAGKPFQIREYPVPDPEPGAILVKVAMANVCGSDLHYWRGELDYVKMGRPLPLNTGHEHVGRVAKLGPGVTTDSAGRPLAVGDRVAYRFFFPCGRCRACLKGKTKSCPVRQANFLVSCEVWPHFQGGFGEYFYLRPNHAVFKLADDITDDMAAGVNCAFSQVYAGLDLTALRQGQTVVIQGAGGLGVYACAVAREMGAARVIIIDGVEERLALARAFGATDVVDMREHPTPDDRIKAVKKLTDDWGGDIVMDTAGTSPKVALLRATGRASLCVQTEAPPYKYVVVEGTVAITDAPDEAWRRGLARRYLGDELGDMYTDATKEQAVGAVTIRLTPTRWHTTDFGKQWG